MVNCSMRAKVRLIQYFGRSTVLMLSLPEHPTRWHPHLSSLLVPLQLASPMTPASLTDTRLTVKHASHQLQAIQTLDTVAHNN